ncbi:Fungal chitosanase [Penicillium griseofulvum]|uniref:Endo-chitosanase n=1 Tax=Penicillium patulum TaxID=5078 RepID=A0A135LS23_PENPA|nr:Fungal chitosanase [Penicillium griseofulvum]KXG51763.1 Fungal chitosanase [Penicillium griseofulvum]
MHVLSTLILSSIGLAFAYEVPANLQAIYDSHKKCKNVLAGGFDDGDDKGKDMGYCGDIDGAIFLYSNTGAYGDMDIDCDGANRLEGDCYNDGSGQSQTAFMDELEGIDDLDAGIHPYVVFGTGDYDPRDDGMKALSVMAVVCGGKLHYGIWGDTNGHTATGEASLSMAKLCFPDEDITGDSGHSEKDVLYIGFKGSKAVPGSKANWKAKNSKEFEASIKSLGDELVKGLGSAGSQGRTDTSSSSFATSARTTKSRSAHDSKCTNDTGKKSSSTKPTKSTTHTRTYSRSAKPTTSTSKYTRTRTLPPVPTSSSNSRNNLD